MFRASYFSCMSKGMFTLSAAPGNTSHLVILHMLFYIWYWLTVHSSFSYALNGGAFIYQQVEYIPN